MVSEQELYQEWLREYKRFNFAVKVGNHIQKSVSANELRRIEAKARRLGYYVSYG